MHQLLDSDPLVRARDPSATTAAATAAISRTESSLAKFAGALSDLEKQVATLSGEFARFSADEDDSAFTEYLEAFESLGRPPKMDRAQFSAERRAAETRADLAKAAEAEDLANSLPERRRTTFGKLRS